MPRPKSDRLPPRVHIRHGAYYWVQPGTERWIRLAAVRDGEPAMYRALAQQLDDADRSDSMPLVIARWVESKRAAWAPKTLQLMTQVTGVISTAFARMTPADVTTPIVHQYLQQLADRPRLHNIHRNVLMQVLAHAAIEGLRDGHNPVRDIKGRSTPGRRRIVTDAELAALRAAGGPALHVLIGLALLTGQRVGDIIGWRWQDVTPAGLVVEQGKTGTRLTIEITPALAEVLDLAAAGRDRIGHVLVTRTGGPYTYAGIRMLWDRACARAGIEDLHIHDLRGRAGVDKRQSEGIEAAKALLGHRSMRMTEHYTDGKTAVVVKPTR